MCTEHNLYMNNDDVDNNDYNNNIYNTNDDINFHSWKLIISIYYKRIKGLSHVRVLCFGICLPWSEVCSAIVTSLLL